MSPTLSLAINKLCTLDQYFYNKIYMIEKKMNLKVFWTLYIAACVVIAVLSFMMEHSLESSKEQLQRNEFIKAQDLLVEKVESFIHGLQGIGGLYITNDFNLKASQVETYARFRNNFNNFPGALGFGFIRIVDREKKSIYERSQKTNNPNFLIRSLGDDSHLKLFVIETIEPLSHNQLARGLDVGSEPTRQRAALGAIDSGRAVLTGSIQLVQTDNQEPGFLFFLPLYRSKTPPMSIEARRKDIVGFAYAPILLSPLTQYLRERSAEKLHFQITDVTDGANNLLYQGRDFNNSEKKSVPPLVSEFMVGGRTWRMEALGVQESFFLASQATVLFAALVIWLITSILFWSIYRQIRRRYKNEVYFAKLKSVQSAILDASTYSIISTDSNGVITTFNKAAENLLGYEARDMVGKKTPAIIHVGAEVLSYAQELSKLFNTHVEPGFEVFIYRTRVEGSDTKEWTYVRKDQSTFPVRLTTTVVRDQDQEIMGYLGVAEDLTREKDLQDTVERQQTLIMASAKMSALGEMAAGVSHEINNPLAIISGLTSVMEFQLETDGKLEGEMAQTNLKKIQTTVDRIARIVQGLRSFARESSSDKTKKIEISVVVQETMTFCQERFRIHGVKLNLEVPDGLSVQGHSSQLSQVLLNLLNNSYDAIHDLPEKWIRVRGWQEGENVFLSITDSGPGIPAKIVERMMEPFFTSKEVGKGTGLGLSISLGIIRTHGGMLDYNTKSKNTEFLITLPYAGQS